MSKHLLHIREELQEHLPYTIFSVATGIIVLGILTVLLDPWDFPSQANKLFHVFHPLHLLFSATATTAMFWRHDKKLYKAIPIGLIGSIGLCGLSDIIFPFLAGKLLGVEMELHICIIVISSVARNLKKPLI